MTDKEKAKELSHKWIGYYRNSDVETICLEMAAWKEQQMIEILLKKQEEADDTTTASYIGKIIEDFKKAMEKE